MKMSLKYILNIKHIFRGKQMSEERKYWTPSEDVLNYDVEGLVGKKLTAKIQDREYDAVIAGVDPFIGISLVEADDPEEMLRCLHGPYDPTRRERYLKEKSWQKEYGPEFKVFVDYLREAVEERYFDNDVLSQRICEKLNLPSVRSGFGNCPFGA